MRPANIANASHADAHRRCGGFIAWRSGARHYCRDGAVFILAAILLSGCVVGPDYHRPDEHPPAEYGVSQAKKSPTVLVDLTHWWETFQDPALDRLINEAVQSNLDVKLAQARVREARAEYAYVESGFLPTVSGNGSFSRSRLSNNALIIGGENSGSSGSSNSSGPISVGTHNLYQAGFDASWELDVFGAKRALESARASIQAQIEARRNALVTLLSEVAQNYIMLRGYQHELAIIQQNIKAQQDTLNLQIDKLHAGISTQLSVAQAQALVFSTQSEIPSLETEIQQAIERLSVLLDRPTLQLTAELAPNGALPTGPPSIPPGLPTELLRRRPDVRQAERQLAAATANIGYALSDLFPKFNLTGSLGLESVQLRNFASSPSQFWSASPSVTWLIFDAGQVEANVHIKNALEQEALIQYRQTVIQAISDVNVALVAYDREQARRHALTQEVDANQQALKLAEQLNKAGLVDFLNVLTAQQSLFQSQDQLAQSNQTVSTNLVALYKALGGGWETTDVEPPERK